MLENELKEYRRKLHRIPEVEFALDKTQCVVKSYLESFGYSCRTIAKTGVLAIKQGKEKKSIAFRSDMDALMVNEMTEVDFKSEHDGMMHACGHDGHMAILLGFAKYVSELETNKTIVFIFQPAEEGPGGAELVIEEDIFQEYQIEKIFGLHLFPGLDEGTIGLCNGPLMAQTGEIDITIHGKSSHGAIPQTGIDAIVVSSQLINAYQSIISRNINPLEGAVLTIGKITGGEARNVIANTVSLSGTIRAFKSEVFATIKDRIKAINNGFESIYHIKIDTNIHDSYPAVVNDDTLFTMVKEALKEEKTTVIEPMMIAEDFAYYQRIVPGFFFMLGTKNSQKGFVHPLHSCYFNFDESVLSVGVRAYISICKALGAF